MTEAQAIRLAAKYGPLLIGKPISEEVNEPIEEVQVKDFGNNNFNVVLISEFPGSDVDNLYRTLFDYISKSDIPYDPEDFGLNNNK